MEPLRVELDAIILTFAMAYDRVLTDNMAKEMWENMDEDNRQEVYALYSKIRRNLH